MSGCGVYREALAEDEEFVPLDPRCGWRTPAVVTPLLRSSLSAEKQLGTLALSASCSSDCSMHTPSTALSTHGQPPLRHISPQPAR